MTNEAQPAAVYAPLLSAQGHDELRRQLLDHNLYVSDHDEERTEHLRRPPHQRPQLMRRILHVRAKLAGTFVTDDLTQLGPTRAEQLAVVSQLLELGAAVIIEGKPFTQEELRMFGPQEWSESARITEELDRWSEGMIGLLEEYYGERDLPGTALMCDTAWGPSYGYGEACLRAEELLAEGVSASRAADALLVEGYENRKLRHVWYTERVRDAAADAKAKTRALAAREAGQHVHDGRDDVEREAQP